MAHQKEERAPARRNWWLIPILAAIIVCSAWFAKAQMDRYNPDNVAPNPAPQPTGIATQTPSAPESPSPTARAVEAASSREDLGPAPRLHTPFPVRIEKHMTEALDAVGASSAQKKRIMNIPGPRNLREFAVYGDRIQEVLTPQQTKEFRKQMIGRMSGRLNRIMDRLTFEDRLTLLKRLGEDLDAGPEE